MPGTNNEAARKEEVKKIVENRRRKAELIREQQIKKRNTIIAIGVGIGNVPEALAQLPTWVSNIFAQNGIIMTFVIATILNLVLPKDKVENKAVSV